MQNEKLILDLEKKLNLYKTVVPKHPIAYNESKINKLIEIVFDLNKDKNVLDKINLFNKNYNENLEFENNKLKYNPDAFSQISILLYEKLFYDNVNNRFEKWLKIIDKCFIKYSFWYWIESISNTHDIKLDFLDELTNYIINNKISEDEFYSKLNNFNKNKPSYLTEYFDIENLPNKFKNLYHIYDFFKKREMNEVLFEFQMLDLRNTLIHCLIREDRYDSFTFNKHNYQRVYKVLDECTSDYSLIGELLTTKDIKFNTYLLSNRKYCIYGLINIIDMEYYPFNLFTDDIDYAKEWIDIISSQIIDIFFTNFKSEEINNNDIENLFNALNTLCIWYIKGKSNYYLIKIVFEKFLDKFSYLLNDFNNKNIVEVLVKKQINLLEKETKKINLTHYFILSWCLKSICRLEKIHDIDYLILKSQITNAIYKNMESVLNYFVDNKWYSIDETNFDKIDFEIFYKEASLVTKNNWTKLLDINILKNNIDKNDCYEIIKTTLFYIKLLMKIYNENDVNLEKPIINILIEFGIKEEYGILFYEKNTNLYLEFLIILNSFTNENYEYFLDRFLETRNLKYYLQLYSNTYSAEKKLLIMNKIDNLDFKNEDFNDYSDIRNCIDITLNNRLDSIAEKLIKIYENKVSNKKQFLQNEKIAAFDEFKYKKDLINICFSENEIFEKIKDINNLIIPKNDSYDLKHYVINEDELENYKKFIIALVYIDDKPITAYKELVKLCDESLNSLFLIHMLNAYYLSYKDDNTKEEKFKYILNIYDKYDVKLEYEKNLFDFQVLLLISCLIKDESTFLKFWNIMPNIYKYNISIVQSRYEFLINNNKNFEALSYLKEVEKFHGNLDKEDKKIIDDLKKEVNLETERSLIYETTFNKEQIINDSDIGNSWRQIKFMDSESHAKIFGGKESLEDYIFDIMHDIAEELLKRKVSLKNTKDNKLEYEDIITDWVCSLLEQRKKFLSWQILPQNRGGFSESKSGVGERDLIVKDGKVKKLFLFEAFKTNIEKHLNKLDKYNAEGFNLILVFAYSNEKKFNEYTKKYRDTISSTIYDGFDTIPLALTKINMENPRLCVFKEIRKKNQENITLFHYLLDFN